MGFVYPTQLCAFQIHLFDTPMSNMFILNRDIGRVREGKGDSPLWLEKTSRDKFWSGEEKNGVDSKS